MDVVHLEVSIATLNIQKVRMEEAVTAAVKGSNSILNALWFSFFERGVSKVQAGDLFRSD